MRCWEFLHLNINIGNWCVNSARCVYEEEQRKREYLESSSSAAHRTYFPRLFLAKETSTVTMVVATDRKAKVAQELEEAGARIEELEAELEEAKATQAGLKAKLDYFEGRPAAGKEAQRLSSSRRYELPEESDDEELVPE